MPPESNTSRDRPTLIILDGDPATGKTEWATRFRATHPANVTTCATLEQATDAIEGRYSEYVILDPEGKLPFDIEVHRFETRQAIAYLIDGEQVDSKPLVGHTW